jgi:hypothetical protein
LLDDVLKVCCAAMLVGLNDVPTAVAICAAVGTDAVICADIAGVVEIVDAIVAALGAATAVAMSEF